MCLCISFDDPLHAPLQSRPHTFCFVPLHLPLARFFHPLACLSAIFALRFRSHHPASGLSARRVPSTHSLHISAGLPSTSICHMHACSFTSILLERSVSSVQQASEAVEPPLPRRSQTARPGPDPVSNPSWPRLLPVCSALQRPPCLCQGTNGCSVGCSSCSVSCTGRSTCCFTNQNGPPGDRARSAELNTSSATRRNPLRPTSTRTSRCSRSSGTQIRSDRRSSQYPPPHLWRVWSAC